MKRRGDYLSNRWRVKKGREDKTRCLAVLVLPLTKKDISKASVLTFTLFLCVLIGEILGRAVFFGANVPLGEVMPYIIPPII